VLSTTGCKRAAKRLSPRNVNDVLARPPIRSRCCIFWGANGFPHHTHVLNEIANLVTSIDGAYLPLKVRPGRDVTQQALSMGSALKQGEVGEDFLTTDRGVHCIVLTSDFRSHSAFGLALTSLPNFYLSTCSDSDPIPFFLNPRNLTCVRPYLVGPNF